MPKEDKKDGLIEEEIKSSGEIEEVETHEDGDFEEVEESEEESEEESGEPDDSDTEEGEAKEGTSSKNNFLSKVKGLSRRKKTIFGVGIILILIMGVMAILLVGSSTSTPAEGNESEQSQTEQDTAAVIDEVQEKEIFDLQTALEYANTDSYYSTVYKDYLDDLDWKLNYFTKYHKTPSHLNRPSNSPLTSFVNTAWVKNSDYKFVDNRRSKSSSHYSYSEYNMAILFQLRVPTNFKLEMVGDNSNKFYSKSQMQYRDKLSIRVTDPEESSSLYIFTDNNMFRDQSSLRKLTDGKSTNIRFSRHDNYSSKDISMGINRGIITDNSIVFYCEHNCSRSLNLLIQEDNGITESYARASIELLKQSDNHQKYIGVYERILMSLTTVENKVGSVVIQNQ